ncbi:MAG: lipocalin family protein [Salinimicrobium sp.]
MKKLVFFTFLTLLLSSCSSSPEEQITNLEGYWQIQTAELPEGITKEFRFSELVDYIEVDGKEGYRTKVRPQLGGKFLTSETQEKFSIKVENDSVNLYYKTPFNSWKETVLSSEEEELKILNPKGIIYTYKRFTPYSSDYGQEK